MYEIIKRIGSGSYGKVYSAKNKHDMCAIKRIRTSLQTIKDKEALINEIKIIKFSNCPYIINFVDCKFNGYNLDLITNLAALGDFYKIIKKRLKPFEEQQLLCYFIQTTLGVKYLHDNNIIHRDIKSANIFLDYGDRVYIGDFGISKILNKNQSLASTQIGTPYYMSPELINSKAYSTDVDIWALGCFLFELITFYPPFLANTMKELSFKINKIKFCKKLSEFENIFSKELIECVPNFFFDVNKRISANDILDMKIISNNMYLIPYSSKNTINIEFDLPPTESMSHYSWSHICEKLSNNKNNESRENKINKNFVLPPIALKNDLNLKKKYQLEKPKIPKYKNLEKAKIRPISNYRHRNINNKIKHENRWVIPTPRNKEFGIPPPLPNILTHFGANNKDNYKSNYNINYGRYKRY